jgi:hypothetical protein
VRGPRWQILVVVAVACRATDEQPAPRWDPPAPSASASALPAKEDADPDTDPSEPDVATLRIEEIAVGGSQRCARMSNDSVRCWGWHEWHALPRAGNGRSQPPVRGLRAVKKLALGYAHACALLQDGTVRCWGSNHSGALGDGTAQSRTTPVPVLGLKGVVDVAAGFLFTCALLNDRTVRCWGDNGTGKLGIGTPNEFAAFDRRTVPRPVVGLTKVAEIALGNDHACARGSDGTVHCWGKARAGALGVEHDGDVAAVPMQVVGLRDVVQIAAGQAHSCARLAGGSVYCWGNNSRGEVGDGTKIARRLPVEVPGFHGSVDLQAGDSYTCAVMVDRGVRCSGLDGPSNLQLAPTPVAGLAAVRQLALGNGKCALLESGDVACWDRGVSTFGW